MGDILKLNENLYIDLSTGICRRTKDSVSLEISKRLTKGQMVILNHLVRNKEAVCSKRSLEALLESDLGESKSPCIKGHLSRIKQTLKKVDEGLGKEMGNRVFRSISGVGYMFCLPEGGEIIKGIVHEETLIQINIEYIKRQKTISPIQLENLKNVFYGITSDTEIIMQAVCNDLVVETPEYRIFLSKLSSFIFKERNPAGPVFLMADMGAGKSTILCSLAVQTARDYPDWKVYYLDMENMGNAEETFQKIRNNMPRRKRGKILLCIDDPRNNQDVFKEVYQQLLAEKELCVYAIIAERVSYMLNILESNKVYQRNSHIRGIYIDHSEENHEKRCMRSSVVQFYELEIYKFSPELKEKIVCVLINQLTKRNKLDQEIVNQSIECLFYKKGTITDIFLDFERNYNDLARRKKGVAEENYIPRVQMDWDEWKIRCRELDKECTRVNMSEVFPYIAVCTMFGIGVSVGFICKMTGYPYRLELMRLFPAGMGESIQIDYSGRLELRNDFVATNFFVCHPEIRSGNCVDELICSNYMNGATAVVFGCRAFDFYQCQNLTTLRWRQTRNLNLATIWGGGCDLQIIRIT